MMGWLGMPRVAPPPLTAPQKRLVTAQGVGDMLTVTNDGHSYIITIAVRTADAALSASIANAFSDQYLDFNRELKIAAIRRANSLLDEEMAPMRERLKSADEAVETYKQNNGLVTGRSDAAGSLSAGSTVPEEQLAQINAQLIAATGELTTKRASLRQIREAQRNGQLESIPEVIASPLINTLRAQEAELSSRVASLSQTALLENPALQSADAGNADVHRRITEEVAKIAASVASQVAAAEARVNSLRGALDRLQGAVANESRANVTLRQLESEASAARGVYQDYLGRFEHTSSETALQEPEADLISAATVPLAPSGPPRAQYTLLALVASFGLGGFLALLLDRLHPGVRTTEQMEAATGLFGLGLIPRMTQTLRQELEERGPSFYNSAMGQVANVLRFGVKPFRARVVLVTSALPGEGKTVFAISLASQRGRAGERALLIDCDLHKPSVAAALELGTEMSPPVRLGGEAAPVRFHRAVLAGLDVITFQEDALSWTEETAISLRLLITDARERYDLIVLDTASVLACGDAPILCKDVDGAIVVVRWRHTPVAAVTSALRILSAYGVRILGGAVTRVKIGELDAAEGGHAHLYTSHARYFARKNFSLARFKLWQRA